MEVRQRLHGERTHRDKTTRQDKGLSSLSLAPSLPPSVTWLTWSSRVWKMIPLFHSTPFRSWVCLSSKGNPCRPWYCPSFRRCSRTSWTTCPLRRWASPRLLLLGNPKRWRTRPRPKHKYFLHFIIIFLLCFAFISFLLLHWPSKQHLSGLISILGPQNFILIRVLQYLFTDEHYKNLIKDL